MTSTTPLSADFSVGGNPASPTLRVLSAPPLQTLRYPLFTQHQMHVKVLRLDLMHPYLCGNKWFKLRLNLDAIKTAGVSRVISFGGAYFNHLRALAAAGRELGLATLGFVRGEETTPLKPVLGFVRECGMQLRYLWPRDCCRLAAK